MHDSVTVHMVASPERVWGLVSDVTRIGRYSPETFEAQWIDGATGPAVGAKFRGHVKRNRKGPVYWTLLGWARGKTNRTGMQQTLERIRADAEAQPAEA